MTKNNKLLNEQTLRRWAKLADISVINQDAFINEAAEVTEEETEEETVAEEAAPEEVTVELDEAEHEDMEMDMDKEEDEDMDMDMEVDAEPKAEENDVVMAILKALEPFGVEMDDDEEEPGMAHEKDPAMDHGTKDEDPAMAHEDPKMAHNMDDKYTKDDDPNMGNYYNRQDEDELTEAVLKRVLSRISKLDKN